MEVGAQNLAILMAMTVKTIVAAEINVVGTNVLFHHPQYIVLKELQTADGCSISNLGISKLSRVGIMNYRFLTTETNFKALYIYFIVCSQPHQ